MFTPSASNFNLLASHVTDTSYLDSLPEGSTMPNAAFRWGSFNGTVSNGYSNGYAGSRAWCHGTIGPMTLVQVDLSAYAGTPTRLRWIESNDTLIGFTGWYVDDVTVANAAACRNNPLFSDGFENGNLAAWSGTTP